jgi:hypothetical protein
MEFERDERKGKFMKKAKGNELRLEYSREDLGRGVRGKYFAEYTRGTNLVLLSPDVAAVFRDEESVNESLRSLIKVANLSKGLTPRSSGRGKKHRAA